MLMDGSDTGCGGGLAAELLAILIRDPLVTGIVLCTLAALQLARAAANIMIGRFQTRQLENDELSARLAKSRADDALKQSLAEKGIIN